MISVNNLYFCIFYQVVIFLWVLPCRHPLSVPETSLLIILQMVFVSAEVRSASSRKHTHLVMYCYNVCISKLFLKTYPS